MKEKTKTPEDLINEKLKEIHNLLNLSGCCNTYLITEKLGTLNSGIFMRVHTAGGGSTNAAEKMMYSNLVTAIEPYFRNKAQLFKDTCNGVLYEKKNIDT